IVKLRRYYADSQLEAAAAFQPCGLLVFDERVMLIGQGPNLGLVLIKGFGPGRQRRDLLVLLVDTVGLLAVLCRSHEFLASIVLLAEFNLQALGLILLEP